MRFATQRIGETTNAHQRTTGAPGQAHRPELSDTAGILEGTGKNMRHVKVRDAQTMPSEAIAALVREAVSLNAEG